MFGTVLKVTRKGSGVVLMLGGLTMPPVFTSKNLFPLSYYKTIQK